MASKPKKPTTPEAEKFPRKAKSNIEKALPEMDSDKMDSKVAARCRVQRYRATHRRIDYAPSTVALMLIERHLAAGLDNCAAGVIDRLIAAGDKAITGNDSGNKVGG